MSFAPGWRSKAPREATSSPAAADPRGYKIDRQCPWTGAGEANHDRNYPAAVRFLVDDPPKGRAGYKVTAQLFSRGASFAPNDAQDSDLRRLGGTDKLLSTLRANQRKANPSVR